MLLPSHSGITMEQWCSEGMCESESESEIVKDISASLTTLDQCASLCKVWACSVFGYARRTHGVNNIDHIVTLLGNTGALTFIWMVFCHVSPT